MEAEKKIRTIRWDGTCKKCGVKSYFPRVRVQDKEGFHYTTLMCILCYWKEAKNV
jgi:RNase P subunit RPR2